MDRGAWQATVLGAAENEDWETNTFTVIINKIAFLMVIKIQ